MCVCGCVGGGGWGCVGGGGGVERGGVVWWGGWRGGGGGGGWGGAILDFSIFLLRMPPIRKEKKIVLQPLGGLLFLVGKIAHRGEG